MNNASTSVVLAADERCEPDAEPHFWERGYVPVQDSVTHVNPPVFGWVHEKDADFYELQWSLSPDFKIATTIVPLQWSVYAHNEPIPAGRYFWRYRITARNGVTSGWSLTRSFEISKEAALCPQPTIDELRRRVPQTHPRLWVDRRSLARLRAEARGDKARIFRTMINQAERLIRKGPTPEPTVVASLDDAVTRQHWWPNSLQTIKACQEAELLAFVFLLSQKQRYGKAAQRWIRHLAEWNPDSATNWALNDEAAMPILHRLARAYDWAYDCLSEVDRRLVLNSLRRRAADAWSHYQFDNGTGHLSAPYNSHANRAWHILGECAIATLGELREAELWLNYAVTKFYTAYPVWTDEDGGWHEGLNYWHAYMSKLVWWLIAAENALDLKVYDKPFFLRFADYALYTAPPGSPNVGFGDESSDTPTDDWWFVHYFSRKMKNPQWAWWANTWNIAREPREPVLRFLLSSRSRTRSEPPIGLSPSKVFAGTGVAVLNSTLLNSEDNVQLRFKSSLLGRRSHGHDPQNSFTLNAYGRDLLVNCVYRDYHGSPFHEHWSWETKAHNALLVDGKGQTPHTVEARGRILWSNFQDGIDYVAGEAAEAYAGSLVRYIRHLIFIKPEIVLMADEVEAARPARFQLMLHAHGKFTINENSQRLYLRRESAGLVVHYVGSEKLNFRQWSGYDPPPDHNYLAAGGRPGWPKQWHVEASTGKHRRRAFILTVLLPHRVGRTNPKLSQFEESSDSFKLNVIITKHERHSIEVRKPWSRRGIRRDDNDLFAVVHTGNRSVSLKRQPHF